MESNWPSVKLGDYCCKIGSGATPKGGSSVYHESGYICLIRSQSVHNEGFNESGLVYIDEAAATKLKNVVVERNDILLNITGDSVARVCLASETFLPARVNQHVAIIRPNADDFDSRFLRYVLVSPKVQALLLNLSSAGATRNALTKKMIEDFEVSKPPLDVQIIIADMLESLDNKITLNRQINQTLEHMAQALFKSWFIDFDPVVDNALDAGFFEQDLEFPDELLYRAEVRKVVRESSDFKPLSNDIRQLFPTAFEKCSEPSLGLGGWIPGGWMVSTTGDEFTVKGGSTPSTANPEFWEGGDIHWTSPKDLSGSEEKIMLDTERKITCAGLNKITSGLLPSETVLMSSRAPIGYLALTKIPVAINQGYIAIPATKRLSQEYVLYWLNSSIDEIKGIAGGTTFAEISKKTFKSISIVIPNTEAVDIFSVTTKSYLNKMTLSAVERAALEQLRDTLLPKLISGELRLSDSEADTADEVLA